MEVFVLVVGLGGFSAAAQALDISPSMASNHVQALEQRLGAKLLHRTTRRQRLTEIGAAYYTQCVEVLARIHGAETAAREMRLKPTGKLRISAPVALGSHLLVPVLGEYLREYDQIEIDLQLNDRIVDLADEGFDLALRFGSLPGSDLVAYPLRSLGRVICASPAYLARCGTPKKPDDLTTHNCLAFLYNKAERDWQFHGGKPQDKAVHVNGQLTINNGPALLQAALGGIGIAMLPDYLVAHDLADGRLVRLFPNAELARTPLQLVHLPDRQMTAKLRSFIDFATAKLGRDAA